MQPLQSVNCHDSRAHDHERHGPFTRLVRGMVGMVLFGFIWVQLVWFMVCNRCEACVHGSWFGYRWDACEHWSFVATGVTPVSLRPLITVGNLGAWSCLDIVKV